MDTKLDQIAITRLAVVLGGNNDQPAVPDRNLRRGTDEEHAQDSVPGNGPLSCWDQRGGGSVCFGKKKVVVFGPDKKIRNHWDPIHLDTKL